MLSKALNRYSAFGIHLVISGVVASLCATLVFLVWYPGLLAYASGVTKIFFLILAVDVILGPLITLLVFDQNKKELKRDLVIIAIIQCAALTFGLHTVFIVRPVYMVFNSGRFDLTFANQISDASRARALLKAYEVMPYLGPEIVGAKLPVDSKLREEIVSSAFAGNGDLQQLPQYFLPFPMLKDEIIAAAAPLDKLKTYNKQRTADVDVLSNKYALAKTDVGFVVLKGETHDLTIIVSRSNGVVLEMSDLKPWSPR